MSILENTTRMHAVPSFSIFKGPMSDERVETLKHCFFQRTTIDTKNPPAVIRASDGWIYTVAYDTRLPVDEKVEVLISFQQHTYGRFAIIRLALTAKHGRF